MKKLAIICVAALVLLTPKAVRGQSNFFFNIYGESSNLWSSVFLQLPAGLLNGTMAAATDYGGSQYWLRYDIFKIENAGSKADIDNGSYWGFKAKDMFRNVGYGVRFGWQPMLSPFGIYVSCAYKFRRFSADFGFGNDKYKLHYIRPGIGIRITPFLGMLEKKGWSPILEAGTGYNFNVGRKGAYGGDKDQFNNGVTSTFSVGARWGDGESSWSVNAGVEIDNYSIFNKDFTPDGGQTYPYKSLESSNITIFITLSQDF